MELQLYFQMIRRGWWVILITAIVATVTALSASYVITPQYEAVARLILNPKNISASSPDLGLWGLDILNNATVVTTYREVISSNRIYHGALEELGHSEEDMEEYSYEVQVLSNSSVIELSVTGPNPSLVANLANSIGNQAIIFTSLLNDYYRVDFLDQAFPPESPERPQPIRDSILAFGIGILLGGVLAIVRDQLMTSLDAYRQRFQLDNVTGVFNNRHIKKVLLDEIVQNPDEKLSLGIIELENLIELEDTLPTAGYQYILKQVTSMLQQEIRGNDVIGRWTDNSFLVILPKTSGPAAKSIFSRISSVLSKPITLRYLDIPIELIALIGGAEYSSDISLDDMLGNAEKALGSARKTRLSPSIYGNK